MRQRTLPPPERFTAVDACRIVFGALMIPLGVIVLVRTLAIALSAQGILVGSAFIAFGVHRLWLACSRYLLWRRNGGSAT